MSQKEMFAVLRQKEVPAGDWSGTGPGGKKLTVVEHSRKDIGSSAKSGLIRFLVKDEAGASLEIIGVVAEDGSETITVNGAALPHPSIDGGIAGKPIIKGFPPKFKFRGSVIVKFDFDDGKGEDDPDEYRFEGKFGEISL